ncbi:hypothetical protein BV898_17104 [Hypsibius exemplaris]|uniref:Uncharacterized protein n=1 Tax=Hypsibius exemplaris TaxID=2072580 RepID=A0A9X6RM94_HYPEX|nr:hypothetical protein BV898_17104 [Hypsibius exemplaris]
MKKCFPAFGVFFLSLACLLLLSLDVIRRSTLGLTSPTHWQRSLAFWAYPICREYLDIKSPTSGKQCAWDKLTDSFKVHLRQLENVPVALVGDSRMRHMFTYLKSLLDHRHFKFRDSFNDTSYRDPGRNITLNYYARWFPNHDTLSLLQKWEDHPKTAPPIVFFECGAWPLFRFGPEGLLTFERKLSVVAEKFASLRRSTTAIWMKTLPFHPDAESGHGTWIKMRNGSASLEEYSAVFEAVGRKHGMIVWTSAYDDAKRNLDKYMDHVHPGAALIRKAICQMLMSLNREDCPGDHARTKQGKLPRPQTDVFHAAYRKTVMDPETGEVDILNDVEHIDDSLRVDLG